MVNCPRIHRSGGTGQAARRCVSWRRTCWPLVRHFWEMDMKRIFLSLVVAGAALIGATPSWAATVNLGPLPGATNPVTDEQKSSDASGTIDYTFSLGQASQLQVMSAGPLSGISGADTTGISGLSLKVLDSSNTVIATAGSVSAFGQMFTGLTSIFSAGSYTL